MKRTTLALLVAAACGPVTPEDSADSSLDFTQQTQGVSSRCHADIDALFERILPAFTYGRASGRVGVARENYIILEGKPGQEGACSKETADAYRAAMACARSRLTYCLTMHNEFLAKALSHRMDASDKSAPMLVACGIPPSCGVQGAITDVLTGSVATLRNAKQVLNAEDFRGATEEARCNLGMHEAMHWAGNPGTGLGGDMATHHEGDQVYACSRFCGGACRMGVPLSDCLACAGTVEEKLRCGRRERVGHDCITPALTPPGSATLCFTPGNPGQYFPCERCRSLRFETCSGILDPRYGPSECCESCEGQYKPFLCTEAQMNPLNDCKPLSPAWCAMNGLRP